MTRVTVHEAKTDLSKLLAAVESGDQGPRYVTLKGEPPVDSPLAAVRGWLVRQSKK